MVGLVDLIRSAVSVFETSYMPALIPAVLVRANSAHAIVLRRRFSFAKHRAPNRVVAITSARRGEACGPAHCPIRACTSSGAEGALTAGRSFQRTAATASIRFIRGDSFSREDVMPRFSSRAMNARIHTSWSGLRHAVTMLPSVAASPGE